jgi:hypothetical protein
VIESPRAARGAMGYLSKPKKITQVMSAKPINKVL